MCEGNSWFHQFSPLHLIPHHLLLCVPGDAQSFLCFSFSSAFPLKSNQGDLLLQTFVCATDLNPPALEQLSWTKSLKCVHLWASRSLRLKRLLSMTWHRSNRACRCLAIVAQLSSTGVMNQAWPEFFVGLLSSQQVLYRPETEQAWLIMAGREQEQLLFDVYVSHAANLRNCFIYHNRFK